MITLNDQKKLTEDRIYYQKCNNFLLLSAIFVLIIVCVVLFLQVTSFLNINLLYVFFEIMCLVLMSFRINQITTAQKIEAQKFQVILKKFANTP